MSSSSSLDRPLASPLGAARPRASVWPWVPALLLVSLLGTQLLVLSSVLDDPTFATEPDYYRRALDWDSQRALARESQALGWRATVSSGAGSPANELTVSLLDGRGNPVAAASVRALAFPNARAGQARELTFDERSPGVYRALLGTARPGLWELRLSARRAQQRFESTLRFELAAAQETP